MCTHRLTDVIIQSLLCCRLSRKARDDNDDLLLWIYIPHNIRTKLHQSYQASRKPNYLPKPRVLRPDQDFPQNVPVFTKWFQHWLKIRHLLGEWAPKMEWPNMPNLKQSYSASTSPPPARIITSTVAWHLDSSLPRQSTQINLYWDYWAFRSIKDLSRMKAEQHTTTLSVFFIRSIHSIHELEHKHQPPRNQAHSYGLCRLPSSQAQGMWLHSQFSGVHIANDSFHQCRPSPYPGICQRCVEDNVVEQCIFVPVTGSAENTTNDDAFYPPQNQGDAYSFAGNTRTPQHYESQSVPAQTPFYFTPSQPSGDSLDTTLVQNPYGRPEATSYARQSVYQQHPPAGHAAPNDYPAAWPTQAYYDPPSQGRGQSTFGPDTPATNYPVNYLANYSNPQGNNPANNPSNWTGTTDDYLSTGYIDPNGYASISHFNSPSTQSYARNYYPSRVHDQPGEGDSEPKE